MIVSGAIRCVELPPDAADWMDASADMKTTLGLADAAMVLLAERMAIEAVYTRPARLRHLSDNRRTCDSSCAERRLNAEPLQACG
jgi:hypothetical protein